MATAEATPPLVDVKDEQGSMLGRVKPGDTKTQALERVGRTGRLFDKNGLGLLGQDQITLEKGPYLFKEEISPQQNVYTTSRNHRNALSLALDVAMASANPPTTVTLSVAAKIDYKAPVNEVITDDTVVYARDHKLEAFAGELISLTPETLGEDVEWFNLQSGIDSDSSDVSKGLITRKDSRGIIKAVLENAKKAEDRFSSSMSFIIGSPGIGKTRLLTFLLRLLLNGDANDVNVQYFSQKEGISMLFLQRKRTIHAYTSTNKVPAIAGGDLFHKNLDSPRLQTYILLDPKEDGAKFDYPSKSHLIVSCSANSKHFHNIEKEKKTFMCYLGLPSMKEVEAMATKLAPGLDKRVLLSRISNVGPVPRYLFDENQYKKRLHIIYTKGKDNEVNEDLVLNALTNGTTVSNNPTLCGALFAHMNVETTDAEGVKSTNYETQQVSLLSQYAGWLLYQRFRRALVQATINGEDCDKAAVFEKLCSFDLIVGGNFKVSDMTSKKPAYVMNIPPASSVIRVMPSCTKKETQTMFVQPALSGNASFNPDYEVDESCFEPRAKKAKLGKPFIVLSDGYAAIDFLNTNRQVFQVTVGADHDMKGWVDLLLDAKIISLDDNGMLTINAKPKVLDFYWVVLKAQSGWVSRKAKVPTKADIPRSYLGQKELINEAIKKHVHQFVLFIEKEQPSQFEFWTAFNPVRGGGDRCLVM